MKLNRIKTVLSEKGISQTWLAKQLDKSFSMVNAYACNRIQPNLETLQQIAEILQVDLKDLITDKKERLKQNLIRLGGYSSFVPYCKCADKLPIIYNIKNMTPEEKARIKIDQWFADAG